MDVFAAVGEAASGEDEPAAGGLTCFDFFLGGGGSGEEERDAESEPLDGFLCFFFFGAGDGAGESESSAPLGEGIRSTSSSSSEGGARAEAPGFSAREESFFLGLRLVGVSPGRARAQIARPRMVGQRDCPPRASKSSSSALARIDCWSLEMRGSAEATSSWLRWSQERPASNSLRSALRGHRQLPGPGPRAVAGLRLSDGVRADSGPPRWRGTLAPDAC